MATSPRITPVKDCIAYIEGCGWTFDYYNRPWYVFKWAGEPRGDGKKSIPFTLSELRDAIENGW